LMFWNECIGATSCHDKALPGTFIS
jgi:hypothetical protein